MTTAIIGTGRLGSVIARQLAAGGENLRLANADAESARSLAAHISGTAVAAAGNREALQGAGAVVLALRFTVLKGVITEIADSLSDEVVVVPSNPLSTDAQGNVFRVLPDGQSAGAEAGRLIRTAGFEPARAGGIEQSSRLEVGGDLHDLVVGPAEARSLTGAA
jgi:predicted dinucleotide-binding enzyme